ncbi:Chorion peroxidase, partial [Armadillidium vulgare]
TYSNREHKIKLVENPPTLPKPREIVSVLNNLPVEQRSKVTVMNMQWGQFISHEINDTPLVPGLQCCLNCSENPLESNNCSAIDVKDDPFYEQFGIQCLENRRSAPADSACSIEREQVNDVTAYIDGSVVYGNSKEEADNLRTFSNGQMKVREIGNTEENLNGSCPAEAVCPFKFLPTVTTNGQERILAGDSRAVQQPSLTAMHTLFIRVHNRIASMLAALHSNYDDEKLFQEARKLVIALMQHITYNEYLPSVLPSWALIEYDLPSLPPGSGYFKGYKKHFDASLRNAFSAAAFRFGHSLIADIFNLSNGNNVQLAESFITHTFTFNFGTYPSDFLNGISNQWSEEVDQNLVSSISNKLFARGPNFNHGLDLYSRNIMRGRDHGLPPYTKWREYCGLPCIHNFTDLEVIMRDGVADVFANLYQSVDDIDLYPAAISEKPEFDGIVGPTLTCLLSEQFKNLKFGDRFYYENRIHPNRFTLE